MSPDSQDQSGVLDADMLGGEYPPAQLLGADEYGTTAAEERVDEPLEDRAARDEPEVMVPQREEINLVAEAVPDVESELTAAEAIEDPRTVELDEGDPSERLGDASVPAEVQAMHRAR